MILFLTVKCILKIFYSFEPIIKIWLLYKTRAKKKNQRSHVLGLFDIRETKNDHDTFEKLPPLSLESTILKFAVVDLLKPVKHLKKLFTVKDLQLTRHDSPYP